jgi:glucosamine--fructose-6-phosphate aminotransferase (isomerizing)
MGGAQFESEIREQPAVLARIAASDRMQRLHAAVDDREVVFTGSGSSLFVAQLAALVWRRAGHRASAIAASEARFAGAIDRDCCVVALSQSGRTGDVLDAVDALRASVTIALTNDSASPLAQRASVTIDVAAGVERAVPASKSVTAMAAILLGAARDPQAHASELATTAAALDAWLDDDAFAALDTCAGLYEPASSIIVLGADYGVPVADEIALKIKEATYRHAEGFGAGEFRHGSTALLDASRGVIGIVDGASGAIVGDVLATAAAAQAVTATFGGAIPGAPSFGPALGGTFAPLGWIVSGQLLALALARRAGIDSDAPRGLRKFLG